MCRTSGTPATPCLPSVREMSQQFRLTHHDVSPPRKSADALPGDSPAGEFLDGVAQTLTHAFWHPRSFI
jgi:hypothetical protein